MQKHVRDDRPRAYHHPRRHEHQRMVQLGRRHRDHIHHDVDDDQPPHPIRHLTSRLSPHGPSAAAIEINIHHRPPRRSGRPPPLRRRRLDPPLERLEPGDELVVRVVRPHRREQSFLVPPDRFTTSSCHHRLRRRLAELLSSRSAPASARVLPRVFVAPPIARSRSTPAPAGPPPPSRPPPPAPPAAGRDSFAANVVSWICSSSALTAGLEHLAHAVRDRRRRLRRLRPGRYRHRHRPCDHQRHCHRPVSPRCFHDRLPCLRFLLPAASADACSDAAHSERPTDARVFALPAAPMVCPFQRACQGGPCPRPSPSAPGLRA